MPEYILD